MWDFVGGSMHKHKHSKVAVNFGEASDRANFTWGRMTALPPVRQLKPYVFARVDAVGSSGPVAEAMSCK